MLGKNKRKNSTNNRRRYLKKILVVSLTVGFLICLFIGIARADSIYSEFARWQLRQMIHQGIEAHMLHWLENHDERNNPPPIIDDDLLSLIYQVKTHPLAGTFSIDDLEIIFYDGINNGNWSAAYTHFRRHTPESNLNEATPRNRIKVRFPADTGTHLIIEVELCPFIPPSSRFTGCENFDYIFDADGHYQALTTIRQGWNKFFWRDDGWIVANSMPLYSSSAAQLVWLMIAPDEQGIWQTSQPLTMEIGYGEGIQTAMPADDNGYLVLRHHKKTISEILEVTVDWQSSPLHVGKINDECYVDATNADNLRLQETMIRRYDVHQDFKEVSHEYESMIVFNGGLPVDDIGSWCDTRLATPFEEARLASQP